MPAYKGVRLSSIVSSKEDMEQKNKKDTELQNGDKAGYRLVMENENYADSFNQKRHGTKYQQHFILMLCLMILGLLCFLTFNSKFYTESDYALSE